jgi:hypothetical protein
MTLANSFDFNIKRKKKSKIAEKKQFFLSCVLKLDTHETIVEPISQSWNVRQRRNEMKGKKKDIKKKWFVCVRT